jgi:TPR repeat protein
VGVPKDLDRAGALAVKACHANVAKGCFLAGSVFLQGPSGSRSKSMEYLERACDLGLVESCDARDRLAARTGGKQ